MKIDIYLFCAFCIFSAAVVTAGSEAVDAARNIRHQFHVRNAVRQHDEAVQRGDFKGCETDKEITDRAAQLGLDARALHEAHILPF